MTDTNTTEAALQRQGALFGRYLVGKAPSDAALQVFVQALIKNPGNPSKQDAKLLAFLERRPQCMSIVDGGLVFVRPSSEVRRRLYIMLSILESMPEYSGMFLPKQRSNWYLAIVMLAGIRGVFRAIFGIIFLKGARL